MAERAAAALIHEFAALRAEREVVRPFASWQRAGRGGAAVLALDAGGAEPNAVFRFLLGIIGAAHAKGVKRPRALIAGQHVLLQTAYLAKPTFATNPILDQLERRLERSSGFELN